MDRAVSAPPNIAVEQTAGSSYPLQLTRPAPALSEDSKANQCGPSAERRRSATSRMDQWSCADSYVGSFGRRSRRSLSPPQVKGRAAIMRTPKPRVVAVRYTLGA
jgi:hypothetical protein